MRLKKMEGQLDGYRGLSGKQLKKSFPLKELTAFVIEAWYMVQCNLYLAGILNEIDNR